MQKVLFIFFIMFRVNAFAGEQSCIEKYSDYIKAKVEWQNNSTDLVVKLLPEHFEFAHMQRDVQLLAIKRRGMAVQLVFKYFSDEISVESKLNQWVSLTPNLVEKLSKKSIEFQKLTAQYQQAKSTPLPGKGDAFRQAFRAEVVPSTEFDSLLKGFNKKVAEIDAQECH